MCIYIYIYSVYIYIYIYIKLDGLLKARVVVAWLAAFLMEFYLDQVHGAPEDLKLMAECTCLVCIFITELLQD